MVALNRAKLNERRDGSKKTLLNTEDISSLALSSNGTSDMPFDSRRNILMQYGTIPTGDSSPEQFSVSSKERLNQSHSNLNNQSILVPFWVLTQKIDTLLEEVKGVNKRLTLLEKKIPDFEENEYNLGNTTVMIESNDDVQIEQIRDNILKFFIANNHTNFEDGMESQFSISLIKVIEDYGDKSIEIISDLVLNEKVGGEVASEALRWIGYIDNEQTYNNRLKLLEKSLFNSNYRIRDGAILGLSFMNDPKALNSLKEAYNQEKSKLVKRNMKQVIDQLEGVSSVSHL